MDNTTTVKSKYNHTEEWHTHDAGNEIIPWIMENLQPETVIDIGCGIGTFTSVFKKHGAKILAVDGPWCSKELLFKNIAPEEFIEHELEKPLPEVGTHDLAVCLEVAEHLTPERAASFVEELTKLSDVILFSAAIPGQGGDHHYNEQWLDYWENLFNQNDYEVCDVLRPLFWENENIFWWYRQNIVLVKKKSKAIPVFDNLKPNHITKIIHPGLLATWIDYKDKNAVKRYTKLLYRAIMFKLGLKK